MPFVPLNAERPAPRRGFTPINAEAPPRRGFTPLGQAAPPVPADTPTQPLENLASAAAARSALLPMDLAGDGRGDTLPEASARPLGKAWMETLMRAAPPPHLQPVQTVFGAMGSGLPAWWERFAAGVAGHENVGQNIGDLLSDRIPRIDPATGQPLTLDQRRGDRVAFEQWRRDARGIPEAAGLGDVSADVLGAIVKEATDPFALMTGAIGAGAKGMSRVLQLGAAGGAYEGIAALLEQLSDAGEVTSPFEIGARAAAGAVLTPALDAAIRGIGVGIKRLLERRRQRAEAGEETAAEDAALREGVAAAAEEAQAAGVEPELAIQRLMEVVQTDEGAIVVPSREPFESPLIPKIPELPPPQRGFTPVTDAPSATPAPASAPDPVATAGRRRGNMAQLADEYERLARATTDPTVRTELLQKAAFARGEARGAPPKSTPRQRAERARRVDPTRDPLDIAIRKLGGIDTELETDWTGRLLDVPKIFGLPALERPGKGQSLDALAERLFELGYLDSFDQGELAAKLARVERGEQLLSRDAGTDLLEQQAGRHTDRDFRFEPEPVERIETDFVVDVDDGSVVPARLVELEDLQRLQEDEINAARFFEAEEAAGSPERPGGLPGDGEPGLPGRLADPVARRPGDESEPGEALLRSYDDAELRAADERRARLDAEAEARAREADARAAADRAREDFRLTGSDRQADLDPRQGDLTDYTSRVSEPGSPHVQQPAGPGAGGRAAGRGADAVPEQLELFAPRGADTRDAVAALEAFGSRVRYTGTGELATGTRRISNAGDVAHVVAQLRKEPQESLLAVVTDDDGNILRIARHTVGTRNASQVDVGLLAATAHSTPGGRRVWFVHHHPSGRITQSDSDRAVTRRLHDALRDTGVEPQGMVVVTPGGRYSFEHPDPSVGNLAGGARIPAAARRERIPIDERRFQRIAPASGEPIANADGMRAALDAASQGREGVMLLDNSNQPLGFLPMSADDMVKLRQGEGSPAAALYRALDETNASATAAIIEDPDPATLARTHANLSAFGRVNERTHLDTFNADGMSAAEHRLDSGGGTFYANPFGEAARLAYHSVRNNAAAAGAGSLIGGMAGGMASDDAPGSAEWWADVGFGALMGAVSSAGLFGTLRRANIVGEGSLADLGVQRAGRFLGQLLGRGPAELEDMKRMQRLMRQLLDRQTGEIGAFLRDQFTPSERALMADLIEGRGIVPDLNRVHTQAKALDDYLSFVTRQMKEYGLLPPDIEEGGYLHRYYAKHLGLDKTFQEAKRQSLSGSYTIARGMVDTFGREYMSPGVTPIIDEVEALLREKSLLERGLFERATQARAAGARPAAAAGALPDEAILRPPPGTVDPPPAMSIDEAVRRTAEIDERLAELRKVELVEMVGEQNGRLRSFFFTRDEVGRVESGVDPVLARLFKRDAAPAGGASRPQPAGLLEDPVLTPPPGRVAGDATAAPPGRPAAAEGASPPNIGELSPTERVWHVKTTDKDGVKLKRDWTRRERDAWGEIRDAGYRFTRGMAEASHDLSLGKLFHDVSRRREWVRSEQPGMKEGEWVQVSRGKTRQGAWLERYGVLDGKWVRKDVWRALKRHGVAPNVLGPIGDIQIPWAGKSVLDVYRGALNRWKIWKTVYNPVTHFNNTYSNVEMLYMGGYGPGDLARGLAELARGEQSTLWREARDAGVLDTDFGTATLQEGGSARALEDLAEQLRTQREDVDGAFGVDTLMRAKEWWIKSKNAIAQADGRWNTGVEVARAAAQPLGRGFSFIKRPVDVAARSMQRAYRFEDNVFKMGVFAAERAKGRSIDEARRKAQDLFFDYSDLPYPIKLVRDFPIGAPFISYTYKALPAVVQNIVRHPERVLGLIAAYEAANFAVLVNEGMDPDRYFEVMDAYENTLPPWDSGRSLWGARNFVLLPGATNLVALGRSHALGNPFMAEAGDRAAAVPGTTAFWGSDIFGGNPLHAFYDVLVNEDWRGKEIYAPGAPDSTKVKKSLAYLYQSFAPSNVATPGSYHQVKVLEGLANDAREAPDGVAAAIVEAANGVAEALGMEQFTGLNRMGAPVDSTDAALGTLGVKRRPVDTDQSVDFESSRLDRAERDAEAYLSREGRLLDEGRKTEPQFEQEKAKVLEEIEVLRREREALERARDVLKETGLLDRQADQAARIEQQYEALHGQLAALAAPPAAPRTKPALREPLDIEITARGADGRASAFSIPGLGEDGGELALEVTRRDASGRALAFQTRGLDGEDLAIEIVQRDTSGRARSFRVNPTRVTT